MVDLKNLIRSILREELQGVKQENPKDDSNPKQQAKEIIFKANEEALKIKQEVERQARKTTEESLAIEKRLMSREQQLEEKEKQINQTKELIIKERESLEQIKKDYEDKREAILEKLEKVAAMSKDQARTLLISGWEEKLKADIAKRIKQSEEEIKEKVDEKAKALLIDAMRYGATDYVAEYTLSVIDLPNEDFKGRIIGKDGRNIRAFELASGVDVDLEEEGTIKLSSFDAVRREIARIALERLIRDGRIQPERIEEVIRRTKEEIEKTIVKAGQELCEKVGVFDLPFEVVKFLGRFKYRYSYGQNMIVHTLEETKIGTALAHELGANVQTVKLGCLLHDIGKVIVDKEGSHVQLGVELLRKNGMPQSVIDCVASHHEDIPFPSIEAVIVYIADAISGARPGARYEDIGEYVKRLKTLEDVASSFPGIEKAYALQAGRELRVIIDPGKLDDASVTVTTKKIAQEIEKKFPTYPGT